MHSCINGQLLDPGRDEETARVVADDPHLEHAVHVRDPVVDPLETAAGALDVAAKDTAEETTEGNGQSEWSMQSSFGTSDRLTEF